MSVKETPSENFNTFSGYVLDNDIETNIIFKETEIKQYGESKHPEDKSGESKQLAQTQYLFSNGGAISIDCTDWSEKFKSKYGYIDNLSINLYSKEYEDFVRYEAF